MCGMNKERKRVMEKGNVSLLLCVDDEEDDEQVGGRERQNKSTLTPAAPHFFCLLCVSGLH